MQIVIDISEERYKDIQRIADVQLNMQRFRTAEQIIANGIPIQKEPVEYHETIIFQTHPDPLENCESCENREKCKGYHKEGETC